MQHIKPLQTIQLSYDFIVSIISQMGVTWHPIEFLQNKFEPLDCWMVHLEAWNVYNWTVWHHNIMCPLGLNICIPLTEQPSQLWLLESLVGQMKLTLNRELILMEKPEALKW